MAPRQRALRRSSRSRCSHSSSSAARRTAASARCAGARPRTCARWQDVPAVPTGAFKELALTSFPRERAVHVFRTSGTTAPRAARRAAARHARGVRGVAARRRSGAACCPTSHRRAGVSHPCTGAQRRRGTRLLAFTHVRHRDPRRAAARAAATAMRGRRARRRARAGRARGRAAQRRAGRSCAAPRSRSCTCWRSSSAANCALPCRRRARWRRAASRGRVAACRARAVRGDRRPPGRACRANREPVRHDRARQSVLRLGARGARRPRRKVAPPWTRVLIHPIRSATSRVGRRPGRDRGADLANTGSVCACRPRTSAARRRRLRSDRPRPRCRGARLLDRARRAARERVRDTGGGARPPRGAARGG